MARRASLPHAPALAALACALLAACSLPDVPGGSGAVTPNPHDPELEERTVEFGTVLVGQTAIGTLTLRNGGEKTAALWLTGSSGPFTVADAPPEIPPGGEAEIVLEFAPEEPGDVVGRAELRLGQRTISVELHGTGAVSGAAACLVPSVPGLEIAATCSSSTGDIIFTNTCDVPVVVREVGVRAGEAIASPPPVGFMLERAPPMPRTVAPGESLALAVRYRPTVSLPDFGELVLWVDGGESVEVPLSGGGLATELAVERFEGPVRGKVDFLFVVDDSPALDPYREQLDGFARALIDRWGDHVDYRVAVTTTSVGTSEGCEVTNGRLLPLDDSRPRFITPAMADPHGVLAGTLATAKTECTPPPANQGLEAARMAVWDADEEDALPRDGAFLSVMFVTAHEDTSPLTLEDYEFSLVDAVGGQRNRHRVTASAFLPDRFCDGMAVAERYDALTSRIGGVGWPVCSPDWTWMLHDAIYSGPRVYELEGSPLDVDGDGALAVPGELAVHFDGVEVPSSAWSYDRGLNAIEFDTVVPRYGSLIEVSYRTWCTGSG